MTPSQKPVENRKNPLKSIKKLSKALNKSSQEPVKNRKEPLTNHQKTFKKH
jgi:hypothetical protein